MENPRKYAVTPLAAKAHVSDHLIQKFKTLRLDALKSAPASFHSNYQHELNYTDEEWVRKMTDPTNHQLICEHIRPQSGHGEKHEKHDPGQSTSRDSEWVGMFTIQGPLSQEQYDFDFEGSQGPRLGSDEEETRWMLGGLYLRSEHRGTDINTAIHEALLDSLRVWTDDLLRSEWDTLTGLEKPKRARIVGTLRSQDPLLRSLYQALGAQEVGIVTRAVALRMAGNDELIGVHTGERHHEDLVAMEKLIDC